jgi:DNA-binding transcriptional LysR family regulator
MELVERFLALKVPTRLRLREEALFGTWEALLEARADLALGVVVDQPAASIRVKPLGEVDFVFAVAPHHELAKFQGVLTDQEIRQHRIVAAADSTQHNKSVSIGILPGQDVLTVPNLQAKLDAQLRGLGCGFLPECMARAYLATGRLIALPTERAARVSKVSYAWHQPEKLQSKALQWWLSELQQSHVRRALLHG